MRLQLSLNIQSFHGLASRGGTELAPSLNMCLHSSLQDEKMGEKYLKVIEFVYLSASEKCN